MGGTFTRLQGKPRRSFGRLTDTNAVRQELRHETATITWLRGGDCAEVGSVFFDASTNGFDCIPLRAGTLIPGRWQRVGVLLPEASRLRARGLVAAGLRDGSRYFVESLLGVSADTRPSLLTQDGQFGFRSGRLGFGFLDGSPAGTLIEASTNLVMWFTDPGADEGGYRRSSAQASVGIGDVPARSRTSFGSPSKEEVSFFARGGTRRRGVCRGRAVRWQCCRP